MSNGFKERSSDVARLTLGRADDEMPFVIDKSGNPFATIQPAPGGLYENVAVLVPCYNEEPTIEKVVRDFQAALPGAAVYVFDNNSVDQTAEHARRAGAIVVRSPRQGKGNVVRHMFDTVEAAYYVMVDGDDTYPASAASELLEIARSSAADMVVGTRLEGHRGRSFRRFHNFGNRVISKLVARVFGIPVRDVLSGYRVFSREFVRSVLLSSPGFEVETELTIQAAARRLVIAEHPILYGERPPGSHSKLSTFGDGFLILRLIFLIFKDHRPFTFFAVLGFGAMLLGLLSGVPAVLDYARSRYVYHVPLAVLAAALCIVGTVSLGIGVLLSAVRNYHIENLEMGRRLSRQLDAQKVGRDLKKSGEPGSERARLRDADFGAQSVAPERPPAG
jgi:glycosyltransferase involved in cell wall biosynthesis